MSDLKELSSSRFIQVVSIVAGEKGKARRRTVARSLAGMKQSGIPVRRDNFEGTESRRPILTVSARARKQNHLIVVALQRKQRVPPLRALPQGLVKTMSRKCT